MIMLRCIACKLVLLGSALAQDVVQVSPTTAKVEYEDAKNGVRDNFSASC